MLAVWTEYLQTWHLFIIVPLALVWIIVGGLAIGYGLRRTTGNKRIRPGQGIIATMLASIVAVIAVGAILLFSLQIGNAIRGASEGGSGPYIAVGAALGTLVALVAAFFVYLSMFSGTSSGQVLKAITIPMLALLVVAGVAAMLSYTPTVQRTLDKRSSRECQVNLEILCARISTIEDPVTLERLLAVSPRKTPDVVPTKLSDLADDARKAFTCPGRNDQEMGYVFCFDKTTNPVVDLLVVSDRPGNHPSTVNAITMTRAVHEKGTATRTFQVVSMPRNAFESMLKEPANAAFAKEYEAARK